VGEMTQALNAHMNNKIIKKKKIVRGKNDSPTFLVIRQRSANHTSWVAFKSLLFFVEKKINKTALVHSHTY
jgi:hypothetical protein